MRVSRSRSLGTLVGVILTIVGCDGPTPPPAPGAVRVVVSPAGEDIIADGLRVVVANGPTRQFAQGLELTIPGLPPGVHAVQLDGLAVNCQVASANPRSVTVLSDETTIVEFNLICTRRAGSIRITTATTGTDLDPDGYVAVVDGGPSQALAVNAATTLAGVREGQRMVTLNGVASNCGIVGAATATVNVQLGATSDVAFSLQCVASGSLEVTVSTTGVDLDSDGYTVAAEAANVNFTGALIASPNGTVTFARLPATDHDVTLQGVAPNCDVTGGDARTVAVVAGATTRVTFDVVCNTSRLLAFARDGDIYVMSEDGTGLTRLTTDPGLDRQPAWSSTGWIAFYNGGDVYVMSENGANLVRLTTGAGFDDAPSWSPDGQKLVFRSVQNANSEIYLANADGSGLTRLTDHVAADVEPPGRAPARSRSSVIATTPAARST